MKLRQIPLFTIIFGSHYPPIVYYWSLRLYPHFKKSEVRKYLIDSKYIRIFLLVQGELVLYFKPDQISAVSKWCFSFSTSKAETI
jgi:hypothetical protein